MLRTMDDLEDYSIGATDGTVGRVMAGARHDVAAKNATMTCPDRLPVVMASPPVPGRTRRRPER